EAIALDQDPLGKQATRVLADADREVWVKELSQGQWGVCLLNPSEKSAQLQLKWSDLPFTNGTNYRVRDLWMHRDLGDTTASFAREIAPHDVALFRLEPIPSP